MLSRGGYNGTAGPERCARARNSATLQTGILGTSDGQRLEPGAPGPSSGADQDLATMGEVDGPRTVEGKDRAKTAQSIKRSLGVESPRLTSLLGSGQNSRLLPNTSLKSRRTGSLEGKYWISAPG